MKIKPIHPHIDETAAHIRSRTIALYGILTLFFILVLFVESDKPVLNFFNFSLLAAFLLISLLIIGIRKKSRSLHEVLCSLSRRSDEYDLYFNSGIDMLCITSKDGIIIRLNPLWEEVLGIKHSELEGKNFFDQVHTDDRENATSEILKSIDNSVHAFECRCICKDESYRWIRCRFLCHSESIYIAGCDITEYKESLSDMTEKCEFLRKQAEAAFASAIETRVEKQDDIQPLSDSSNEVRIPDPSVDNTVNMPETAERVIFDYDGLLRRLMNDTVLVRTILDIYIQDIPVQVETLKKYFHSDDLQKLILQAHTIKGASSNVGAEEIRQTAFSIETAGRRGDISSVPDLINKLEMQLRDFLDYMATRLKTLHQ